MTTRDRIISKINHSSGKPRQMRRACLRWYYYTLRSYPPLSAEYKAMGDKLRKGASV